MPLIFVALLFALPALDIYATLRFAETLGVPAIALFVPGLIFGVMIMKRETRSLKARFVGAIQSTSLNSMVFDSGRKMIAALLLLMPGFVSDVFALFLLLIPNRTLVVRTAGGSTNGNTFTKTPPGHRRDSNVLDGEYHRVD
jgi:UPF0716 protein FxsA